MVSTNMYTMAFSAAIAIVAAVAVGLINNVVEIAGKSGDRSDFLTFGKIIDALEGGAKGLYVYLLACGVAGIISGCITVTGLASKLLSTIVSLSGGHMIIALVLTMICCIVLGMGVPTTANYCIYTYIYCPHPDGPLHRRHQDGGPLLRVLLRHRGGHHPAGGPGGLRRQRHRQGGPHEDRLQRHEAGHRGLYRAYIFAISPQMLFVDVSSAFQVVQICITALFGIFGVAAALNGYLYRPIPLVLRLAMAVGGLCMMIPGTVSDIIGFVLVLGILLYQRLSARRAAAA